MRKRLKLTVDKTAFKKVDIVAVAAKPDAEDGKPIGTSHGPWSPRTSAWSLVKADPDFQVWMPSFRPCTR